MIEKKLSKINIFSNILPLLLLLIYVIGYFTSFILHIYSGILLIILLPLFIIFSIVCLVFCKKEYARKNLYVINSIILFLQIATLIIIWNL